MKGYPRLSETFISQEILALQNLGFDFQLISLRHPTDKIVHPITKEITAPVAYLPEYIYQEPLRILKAWWRVRKMAGYKIAWQAFKGDLARDFTRNRIRRFAQGMVVADEFGDEISALYAHFLHTPTSVARYAAKITAKPFAISAHAVDIWTSPDWEVREKLDDCQWLSTCTAFAKAHLQGLAAEPGKVHLVYHGIDLARFPATSRQPSRRTGENYSEPLRIISVSRAVVKKGLDNLLDALALLPEDLHWQWTHIGGGPLTNQLHAQAARLGILEKCQFRGALDQLEVIKAYHESDLFVLANRVDKSGDRDGLPNAILEAQSQGLAVISSPISGIPELIVDKINGLLVEPDEPQLLASAMALLATDYQMRNKMGKTGQARIQAKFSHLTTIGALAKLLNQLQDAAGEPATQAPYYRPSKDQGADETTAQAR